MVLCSRFVYVTPGDSSEEKVDQLSEEEEEEEEGEEGDEEAEASGKSPPSLPIMDSSYTYDPSDPYQCQFCDKAFPRLSYLKRHEQVSLTSYFFFFYPPLSSPRLLCISLHFFPSSASPSCCCSFYSPLNLPCKATDKVR